MTISTLIRFQILSLIRKEEVTSGLKNYLMKKWAQKLNKEQIIQIFE